MTRHGRGANLELLHGKNIAGLDVLLNLGNLLLQLLERDLVVLNDEGELDHAHTVADGHLLGGSPDETVLLECSHLLLHSVQVCLIVPWLDAQSDDRLGNRLALDGFLLCSLLVVFGHSLGLDSLGFGVLLLVVGSEEVDFVIVIVVTLGSDGCSGGCLNASAGGGSAREGVV